MELACSIWPWFQNIRAEFKSPAAFQLPRGGGSVIASVGQVDQPSSLLVCKLWLDTMLPSVVKELDFLCLGHLVPGPWGNLGLDEFDEVLIEKNSSTKTSCLWLAGQLYCGDLATCHLL